MAHALMMVVYIINRSPSVSLNGDVPQRVWTGKDVSCRHLRVFECLAYLHVAKDHRSKLDSKSRPCIFLGYGKAQFKFKLWDLIDKKVIWSWEIVFMQDLRPLLTGRCRDQDHPPSQLANGS